MAEKRSIPETLFDELGFRMIYKADRVLYEMQTEHQHLVLFEHPFFGKMLMLDGATQVTSKDEFVYHEMMSHVPILAHGSAKEVLIVGGGDCGIAEEVLKHKSVRRLTQVEIDASVVEFSKEHFPEFTKPVLTNKRFDLVIEDGMHYVARTDRRFDVIIVDSTDPQGPGEVLFSEKFYAACRRCVAEGGVLVTQNGVPILQAGELTATIRKFRKLFADGYCYVAAIPTYVGGHMAMGWATDNIKLRQASVRTIADRYKKAGRFPTKYWTPEVHVAAFALPRFIAEKVEKAGKPLSGFRVRGARRRSGGMTPLTVG
jgi:spermidine synthase